MRNLRNIQFSLLSSESAITSLCWDIEQDAVLYTHGPTSSSPEIELYRATTSPTGDM